MQVLGRQPGVALDHPILHLDGAAHSIDHTAELDEGTIAGALDHPSFVHSDRGIDEVAPEGTEPRERAVLVSAREPAVSNNIRRKDRSKLSLLGHRATSPDAHALPVGQRIMEDVAK
jgi:hypothetical protein